MNVPKVPQTAPEDPSVHGCMHAHTHAPMGVYACAHVCMWGASGGRIGGCSHFGSSAEPFWLKSRCCSLTWVLGALVLGLREGLCWLVYRRLRMPACVGPSLAVVAKEKIKVAAMQHHAGSCINMHACDHVSSRDVREGWSSVRWRIHVLKNENLVASLRHRDGSR